MALPEYFCWTRFGSEAGQKISHIFDRKEQERQANEGNFLWGVGNAIGPSIRELLQRTEIPEVLFSPIKSIPAQIDLTPEAVVTWTLAETLTGDSFRLPPCSMVTSRYNPSFPRSSHYALVCFSDRALNSFSSDERIAFAAIKNLRTGRPVARSQVTAVVQQKRDAPVDTYRYEVSIRAKLVYPYFLRLWKPCLIPKERDSSDWASAVRAMWDQRRTSGGRAGHT